MKYYPSIPRGYSKRMLKKTRKRFNMNGLVEIHHVVPKQFKTHPTLLREKYNVEEDYNLIFLPSEKGTHSLNLRSRPVHSGGHLEYNLFVKKHLDDCDSLCCFILLLYILFQGSKGRMKIPWK
tara:strand:+ start:96 stop:464 length:369 start_codon:yes stop_codon:yes gene_type:complete